METRELVSSGDEDQRSALLTHPALIHLSGHDASGSALTSFVLEADPTLPPPVPMEVEAAVSEGSSGSPLELLLDHRAVSRKHCQLTYDQVSDTFR